MVSKTWWFACLISEDDSDDDRSDQDRDDQRRGEDETSPLHATNHDVDEEIELEKDTLPPYLPAIHGCRSVEEFQCLNSMSEDCLLYTSYI